MLVMDVPLREDECFPTMNNNNHSVKDSFKSWHPHVYGNPPKQPTPHMICNILGWSAGPAVSPPQELTGVTGDEPLNLTVRSRSPHKPFREPLTNGVDKPINGRMEFTPKVVKRPPAAHVNKGKCR